MSHKEHKPPTAISGWNNEGGAPRSGDRSNRRRPRDANQGAKPIVDVATGVAAERHDAGNKKPAAGELGRRGGLKGPRARAEKSTS